MRIESSVTSVSWIPSAAITGLPRVFFEHGATHYDVPPPHGWTDLHSVLGPEGARFANDLRAWIEVHDGKITAFGQDGALHLNSTLVRLGGRQIAVEAVGYPELRQDPVVEAGFVRFAQTAWRPGRPPRAAARPHCALCQDPVAHRVDDPRGDHLRRRVRQPGARRRQLIPPALDLRRRVRGCRPTIQPRPRLASSLRRSTLSAA
jgi:hypothetical protein